MPKTALIDVIVPIYKVEAYLEKCVESLLNQTFDDYVITLVDDGSPDGCPAICDRYCAAYPEKIRVIHKENGGLSDARNVGVQHSESKFVVFIDSDDYVSSQMLETLYRPYAELDADMVVSSLCRVYVLENGEEKQVRQALPARRVMDRDEALEALFYEKGFGAFACAKLIPRELVLRYPYPKGRFFEDSFTTYRQVCDCRKVVCIPETEYFYLQRSGSIQRRTFEERHMDLFRSAQAMIAYIAERDVSAAVRVAASYRFCRSCYVTLHHATDLDRAGYARVCREIMPAFRAHFFTALKGRVSVKDKMTLALVYVSPRMLRSVVRQKKK